MVVRGGACAGGLLFTRSERNLVEIIVRDRKNVFHSKSVLLKSGKTRV